MFELGWNRVTCGNDNQIVTLDFMDATGNLYITWGPFNSASASSYKFSQSGTGWTSMPMPTGGLGMDGSGNLYRTVDNVVTKVNFARPPNLRFGQTVVGSKSGDSPEVATLQNIGNAPLIFSVPSSGTNPSVATNFALDSSSTCPQISASGSPLSLAMDDFCTYAINFTPTTTGTIDGSLIASDNALNAAGGTQTIPLSGSGTSEGIGMAVLTMGPGGVLQGVMVPNSSPAGAGSSGNVWVDTTHQTLVQGAVYLQLNSQGNPTCNVYSSQTQLTATQRPQFGTLLLKGEQHYIQGCGTTLFPFQVARYTWGPDQSVEQDPFTLEFSTQDRKYANDYAFTAVLSRITVSPAMQSGSGSNPPLTATATLTNPPSAAAGYDWQIIGGNGAIVFPSGQETMSSSTNSITIQEPNPTGTSIAFNIQVGVRYPSVVPTTTAASNADALSYGPAPDTFCSVPTITSISPNVWFAGQSYNVTITGTGFKSCAQSSLSITMSNGGVVGATVTAPITDTQIIAQVTPATNDLTGGATVVINRIIPGPNADILEIPKIQWNTSTNTNNTISAPFVEATQSAVVGQQIQLTTLPTAATLAALPIPLAFSNNPPQNSWQITGTAVGGYPTVPTTPLMSGSGALTPLSSTCGNSSTCTLYWVSSGNPLTAKYTYTLTNGLTSQPVSATFNIQGPSAISLTTPTISPVSIGLSPLYMGMFAPPSTPGIVFNASLQQPKAAQGTIIFVQYLNQVNYQYTTSPSCAPITLPPGVDTAYPYDESPVEATTYSTNDSPGIPLYTNATEATGSFNATMFLMWQPSLSSSPVIPVPLGYITWQWSGDAVQNGGTWSFNQPPGSPIVSTFKPSSSYPPNWSITTVPPNPPCGLHY